MLILALLLSSFGQTSATQPWLPLELRNAKSFVPSEVNSSQTQPYNPHAKFVRVSDNSTLILNVSNYGVKRPFREDELRSLPRNAEVKILTRPSDGLPLGLACELLNRPSNFGLVVRTGCEEVNIYLTSPKISNERYAPFRVDDFSFDEALLVRLAREALSRFAGQTRAERGLTVTVDYRKIRTLIAGVTEEKYVEVSEFLNVSSSTLKIDFNKSTIEFSAGADKYLFVFGSPKFSKNNQWYLSKDIPLIYEDEVWLPLSSLPQ